MQKDKTLSYVNNIMGRIGCFSKAQVDNRLHSLYLRENVEDEAYKMGSPHGLDNERRTDADENTRIEITPDHAILYNASREGSIKSLLEKGANMEYVGSSAGTAAWGKGIYTNFQQFQAHYRTVKDKSLYGGILVKYKYHGNLLDECLVAESQLWKDIGPLSTQVKKFRGLEQFLNKKGVNLSSMDDGGKIHGRSSEGLYGIKSACGGDMAETLLKFGVQGVVFYGMNDKPVAVIYDADKLEVLDYAINSKITDLDQPIKWEGLKKNEGGRVKNDIFPILCYFPQFAGNRKITRPKCGEILLRDTKTGKKTFVDYNKAKSIISSHADGDPRLFGDFEFAMAQEFMRLNGREFAFVQIDEDERNQFYVDKEGNLYHSSDGQPFSNVKNFYPPKDQPMNNDIEDEDDFDISDDDEYEEFLKIFDESIMRAVRKVMNEGVDEDIVRPMINNMMSVMSLIERTWKSPDDLYYIHIDQRLKDFRNYNIDKGFSNQWANGARRWKMEDPSKRDSTRRENNVGYCIIRGRTKEDCKNNILNATVHLNPWAAKEYGSSTIHSDGGMEAIMEACNKFFARAYIVINPRSMKSTIDRARTDKKAGLFRGREFVHRAGQPKSGFDGRVNWDDVYPDAMIDCDISEPQAWRDIEELLKSNGCKIYDERKSHQGMHFIVNYKECKNLDFTSIARKYPSYNKPGDPPILLKHDANFIAYSPAGVR